MTVQELYDHILTQMTAEQALKKMLEAGIINYEKLKFNEGEELHPLMLVIMAAQEMNWLFAIKAGPDDADVDGITLGTKEYLDEVLKTDAPDSNEKPCGCGGLCQCGDLE